MTTSPARLGSSSGNWARRTTLIGTTTLATSTLDGCRNQGSAYTRLTTVPMANTATSTSRPRPRRITCTSTVAIGRKPRAAHGLFGPCAALHLAQFVLVVATRLRAHQRIAGIAVSRADVGDPPADLGDRVGLPVTAGCRHVGAGQRLRDAVRTGACVDGRGAPAALAVPERFQAGPLALGAARAEQQGPPDGARVTGERCPVGGARCRVRLVPHAMHMS